MWVRRDTVHSRWDAPITTGAALYGLAAVLDSPWPGVGAMSVALTGKHFLLSTLGHISYLLGSAIGLKSVYVRLLPDDAIGPFMRTRILPIVYTAAGAMLLAVIASPVTDTSSADHLYLATPDGWLKVYFTAYYSAMAILMGIAIYGGLQLRDGPQPRTVDGLIAAAVAGSLACLSALVAILTGHTSFMATVAWPLAYAATVGAALTRAVSWRLRVRALRGEPEVPKPDRVHRHR